VSLRTKPIGEITFADVKSFCDQQIPEDLRTDYKSDWPKELAKELAAFANTVGGLLIIGVKENPDTRTPDKIVGVLGTISASERVTNAGLSLAPSLAVETTDAIQLEGDPTRSVYVVRVPPSRLAPHIDAKRDRVHVRTVDVSHPSGITSATIDRIALMLQQRDRYRAQRDDFISTALKRFHAIRKDYPIRSPYVWIALAPEFIVGEVATVEACSRAASIGGSRMYVDRGAIGFSRDKVGDPRDVYRMRSVEASGCLLDVTTRIAKTSDSVFALHVEDLAQSLRRTLIAAKSFYSDPDCTFCGPLNVTVAIERAALSFGWQRGYGRCDYAVIDRRLESSGETDDQEIRQLREFDPLLTVEHLILQRLGVALGFEELRPEAFVTWL
jgi:hypothetical protein